MRRHTHSIDTLCAKHPLLVQVAQAQPVAWFDPAAGKVSAPLTKVGLGADDVAAAHRRWQRFAPYLATVFDDVAKAGGQVESPLCRIDAMQGALALSGATLWLKMDSDLPIAGSIKARGGIYEVLSHAEALAMRAGWLKQDDDYRCLASADAQSFFGQYTIAVGSTGNLGLAIGIIATKMGFQVQVHMSAAAQAWKKQHLHSLGVTVIEYAQDYSMAVAAGRAAAAEDSHCFFVDDEHSKQLFLGYAVAGERLREQLAASHIRVDAEHPLFVYLPCGVGGAPGGVAFGLKLALGAHVHCIFVEPVSAPCMLLGVHTGLHERIAVTDIGLGQNTVADGLAVNRPSGFVGRAMAGLIDGYVTVADADLLAWLRQLHQHETIFVEPSACAGFAGLAAVMSDTDYHARLGLTEAVLANANHIVWATGGSMVPATVRAAYLAS